MGNNNRARQESVRELLRKALRHPDALISMGTQDLDLTLRIARRAKVLGTLAARLEDVGELESLPVAASDQLKSVLVIAESRARLARWELDRIDDALKTSNVPCRIVMKGCTYMLLGLPNAPGRIFADVDLLLPEADLGIVERHLNERGWRTEVLTPYDDNYYRKWTHELPPLVHVEREEEIDLHHNILPRTARLKPDARFLLENSQRVKGSRYRVLGNEDIVLHAMTHLMSNDDLSDKLRDLVDIDVLMQHFSEADNDFWQRLLERAAKLDLRRPTYYSLRYARDLLASSIPVAVTDTIDSWAPRWPLGWLMDRLVPRTLFPIHPDHPSALSEICRLMLYIRSHWIRMPPWLLAYHLGYKFYRKTARWH